MKNRVLKNLLLGLLAFGASSSIEGNALKQKDHAFEAGSQVRQSPSPENYSRTLAQKMAELFVYINNNFASATELRTQAGRTLSSIVADATTARALVTQVINDLTTHAEIVGLCRDLANAFSLIDDDVEDEDGENVLSSAENFLYRQANAEDPFPLEETILESLLGVRRLEVALLANFFHNRGMLPRIDVIFIENSNYPHDSSFIDFVSQEHAITIDPTNERFQTFLGNLQGIEFASNEEAYFYFLLNNARNQTVNEFLHDIAIQFGYRDAYLSND